VICYNEGIPPRCSVVKHEKSVAAIDQLQVIG
jgi:hypothetical protein